MNKFSYYVALIVSLLTFQVSISKAQQFGVKGKVLDVETFQPIPGVSIKIANTTLATSTDEKGEFSIALPGKGGEYTLVSTFVGYGVDSTKFNLNADNWAFIPVSLINASSTLDEVVVTRRRERASELALLEERRKSSLTVERIGAQELSRKGVGDAAAAVTKLSGVSKQEGNSQIFVRGLGDRYMTTTLNGLPIPASDANMKNIALDIFSTDVVDYVGVDKVSNVALSGDFGGASIDIASKNFTGDKMLEFSLGSTVNTNALRDAGNFHLQEGPNFFGFSDYKTPADALGSYHFDNSWNPVKKTMIPLNFGVRGGKSFQIGAEGRLKLFATADFSNGYTSRYGINADVNAQGAPIKSFMQSHMSYNTRTTGMFNANYQINSQHNLSYNLLYINSGDQFRDVFSGFIRDAAESDNGVLTRNTFVQTQLLINQLLGKHTLNDRVSVDWGLAYNHVNGDIPDRMQSQVRSENDDFYFIRVNQADNHRYSHYVKEYEIAGNAKLDYKLGADGTKGKISVGYNGRKKKRSLDMIQLNFDINSEFRDGTAIDPANIDQYLGADGFGSIYRLQSFSGNGFQFYNGDQDVHAGFISVDYKLTDKLTAVVGARYEYIKQYVDFYTAEYSRGSNTINKNAFLPSLNLKYELDDRQNLRFGASKTYTLPQFKERARFQYDDVTQVFVGNPYLYASDNYNADLKWEFFPKSSELIAVTAFGKYIQNPINEILMVSAANDLTYANTGEAGYAYGVELELKKDLLTFNQDKLSLGFNSAFMKTHQDFDGEKVNRETEGNINFNPTNTSGSFAGASDVVINADLSYLKTFANDKSITATVLYNYYSDKIFAIGASFLGDRVDKGIGTLDFVLKSKLSRKISVDVAARNILNPEFQRWQQNETPVKILSYKRGAFFNIGLRYQL
ncbi:TonB-dependent receptor [Sphingobacterium oryzagri]|uniref:TonB-dependent receptor n=1 Tax=Sphingobacterium oryzagri TaxID=3025669 RepID=A0ABY7WKF0_9SPHI|nr:TonB-dependent receptor [Sphingobacterium sp. KACC 22765]WDF67844.1 TonB-dependent receptor [Sphingobacterium sp. KACC 22765]